MVESKRQFRQDQRRIPSPWTSSETRRAVELWESGMAAAGIARALGKSRNAVLGKIGRLRLNRSPRSLDRPSTAVVPPGGTDARAFRHRRFAWSREHQARLVRLWRDGLATDEIAARLGCSEALVVERATCAGLASVEAPERHASPQWFARNDARFRAALQRALDRGSVSLPADCVATMPGAALREGPAHGR